MNHNHSFNSTFNRRNFVPALALILAGISAAVAGCGGGPFDNCETRRNCPRGGKTGIGGEGGDSDSGSLGGAFGEGSGIAGAVSSGGTGGRGSEPGTSGVSNAPSGAGAGDEPSDTGGSTSGGSGGAPSSQGGSTAAGGSAPDSAGASGTSVCASDPECDDGLFCNGAEQCVSGECASGTNPCSNADPDDCEVTCSEGATEAVCNMQGVDEDGDGARTKACTPKPGNDCDDTRKEVSPTAKEICDGIDNDCDDRIDLADGLGLSGTNEVFGDTGTEFRNDPAIAWSPEARAYGAIWRARSAGSSGDFALYFEVFNQAATTQAIARELSPYVKAATLTWGKDRFGILYDNSSSYTIELAQVAANGQVLNLPLYVMDHASTVSVETLSLARPGLGTWGVVYTLCSRGGCRVASNTLSTGTRGTELNISQVALGALAATSDRFLMGYGPNDTTSTVEFRDAMLTPPTSPDSTKSLAGTVPIMGTGPSRVAVATRRTALKPFLSVFDDKGKVVCDAIELGDGSFVPNAVVGTKDGFLVASGGAVRVQRVSNDCVPGPILTLGGTSDAATFVSAAGGDDGYAVVWADTATPGQITRRRFGPRLCD